jgi:hypothetical protein
LKQREAEREEFRSQGWVKNTNMTECTQEIGYLQSINSDIHLPHQSPCIDQFFMGWITTRPELEFLNNLLGLGTDYEQGCRTEVEITKKKNP